MLKLATFNLRNLTLPGETVYTTPNYYDQEDYDRKVNWIGNRIVELDADIIGFQELWKVAALEECFRSAGMAEEYEIVGRDAPSPAQVQVAVAVRKGTLRGTPVWHDSFPEGTKFIKRKPTRDGVEDFEMLVQMNGFSRPVLEVRVKPKQRGAPEMNVFVAHLKSKRPIDLDLPERRALPPEDEVAIGSALSMVRRVTEAAALRKLLNERMLGNDEGFVVLGDLNDDYLSVTTTMVTGDPSYKLFEASRVGSKPSKSGDLGLYGAQLLKEYRSLRNVYYTHIFNNKLETLDHILVSEQFYDHSPRRVWSFHDARYINDHLDDERTAKITTDHGILLASFDYRPVKPAEGIVTG